MSMGGGVRSDKIDREMMPHGVGIFQQLPWASG
jgi:hypothetical protein